MTQSKLQRIYIRRAASMNSKARRLGVVGTVSAELLLLIARDYPSCPYCGVEINPEHGQFDHKIAFDNGGANTRDNIVFSCTTCNRSKFTKSVSEHEEYSGLAIQCPIDGTLFKPRYSDWARGLGRYCSRSCSAASRWKE